jgi:hypothetical protein
MFDMREHGLGALVQLYNIEGLLVLTKVPLVHQSARLLCRCSDRLHGCGNIIRPSQLGHIDVRHIDADSPNES